MARDRGLDLVEVAPNSVPPVCRLMDYGRYKYEQQKRDAEAHRTQRTNDLKEVRMAPVIDEHDIDTKTNTIRRFVEEGDKVKVTIQFRGAQMRHQEIGRDVLERILTSLRGVAVLERPIIMEGRNMSMFIGAPSSRQGGAAPAREGGERSGPPAGNAAPRSPVGAVPRPAANGAGVAPRPADPRGIEAAAHPASAPAARPRPTDATPPADGSRRTP